MMSFDKHGFKTIIVRDIGKRAVRVILRPTYSSRGYNDENYIINLAAKFANKRGWKTVYVEPDQIDMGSMRVFNSHQYFYEANIKGYPGKFLCMEHSNIIDQDGMRDRTEREFESTPAWEFDIEEDY